ncbi:MAG: transglycosylase SLT domain-containing protein [Bacteroidales bacterium]|nr:transglycosylase SLT domain-containing protein [Bacteroidales bacterium]
MRNRSITVWLSIGALLCAGFAAYWYDLVHIFDEEVPTRNRTWSEVVASDTLRVGTICTSISAYQYRGRWYGYEYELASQVASELGLTLDLHLMTTEKQLIDSLGTGNIDVVAWPNSHRLHTVRQGYRGCGYAYPIDFRILSAKRLKINPQDSAKYKLAVVEESHAWFLLSDTAFVNSQQLKAFAIDTLPAADVSPDMMAEQLLAGDFDATLVPSNIGELLRDYYETLRLGNPLQGSSDSVSWMVTVGADTLAEKIDSICRFRFEAPTYNRWSKKNFQLSKRRASDHLKLQRKDDGSLTGYDDLFVEYADSVGWDWRMLASICKHESNFRDDLVSSRGAQGIMQIMPQTALAMGCPEDSMSDVRWSIRTASRLLVNLERALRKRIAVAKDSTITKYADADTTLQAMVEKDLVWFTLASYNAGLGQVYDAIAMAENLGYDPAVWEHNVEYCLKLKALPTFYEQPYVRLGKFNANTTIRYVHDVVEQGEAWIEKGIKPLY